MNINLHQLASAYNFYFPWNKRGSPLDFCNHLTKILADRFLEKEVDNDDHWVDYKKWKKKVKKKKRCKKKLFEPNCTCPLKDLVD